MSKISAGTTTIAIGVLHQIVGVTLARDVLLAIVRDGVVGAVERDAQRGMVFWFLLFGFLLILFGASVRAHERAGGVPRGLGFGLAALAIGGGLAIPASGFWLALVPAALILARARRVASPLTAS